MRTILIAILSILIPGKSLCQVNNPDPQNKFALDIYKISKPDNQNYLISPLSINLALAMALEGAGGKTKDEITKLLGLEKVNNVSEYFHSLITKSQFKIDSSNHLDLCNSLWYNKKYDLNLPLFENIKSNYNSEIFSFGDDEIASIDDRIDKWISSKTNNRISSLTPSIDDQTRIAILNATYLIAEWLEKFDKKDTKKRNFRSLDRSSDKIDFMFKHSYLKYFENNEIQVVSLPYAENILSMLIILPIAKYGLPKIENKIDLNYFNEIVSSLKTTDVILYFPKFRIESEISLLDPLQKSGLQNTFHPKADFSLFDPKKEVWLGEILHKTFIETDEEKTEAAAVTEIIMIGYGRGEHEPPPPPKIVDVDHPFLFCITNNRTNVIVFMGRYVKTK